MEIEILPRSFEVTTMCNQSKADYVILTDKYYNYVPIVFYRGL